MEHIVALISHYAQEEGFHFDGHVYSNNTFDFYLVIRRDEVCVLMNRQHVPLYRIRTVKDCVQFCQLLSSVEYMRKMGALFNASC